MFRDQQAQAAATRNNKAEEHARPAGRFCLPAPDYKDNGPSPVHSQQTMQSSRLKRHTPGYHSCQLANLQTALDAAIMEARAGAVHACRVTQSPRPESLNRSFSAESPSGEWRLRGSARLGQPCASSTPLSPLPPLSLPIAFISLAFYCLFRSQLQGSSDQGIRRLMRVFRLVRCQQSLGPGPDSTARGDVMPRANALRFVPCVCGSLNILMLVVDWFGG